jgi:hypothetical protein
MIDIFLCILCISGVGRPSGQRCASIPKITGSNLIGVSEKLPFLFAVGYER